MSNSAQQFKEQGNRYFQQQKFDEAAESYGKAIARNSEDATYFTNRALCYLNLKKWNLVDKDCKRALELDARNVKANYFLGKLALHDNNLDEAIKCLTIANDIAFSQKMKFGDDITNMLRQARREKFKIEEEKRLNQEIELQTYLNQLVDRDIEREVAEYLDTSGDDKSETQINDIRSKGEDKKIQINTLFAQIDERRQKREIPDYLCGKISFELLKDPVITPSGITYDRSDIKEHLHRVGHFDPITREPLTVDQLIPNLAMKEVLDAFLAENEWALDE